MVLDNAITIKPRRQMSVQFSGGEPTISPYFLDAVRYARKVGYNSVQAATNGIEFAKSPEFAKAAAEAGLRYAYLQFDGIGNAANAHRRVGNLFDVKLRAIENLHSAGVDIVPVVTIVNGVNNEQVGRIIEFALDNPKKINFLSFQPVQLHRPRRGSDARAPRGAALHAVAPRARREEPDRHRRAGPRLVPDFVHGQLHRLGRRDARRREGIRPAHLRLPPELRRRHGHHDRQGNQGSGAGHRVPQGRAARQGRRRRSPTPAAAGSSRSSAWRSPLVRNYDSFKSPTHFKLTDLLKKFDKTFGATKSAEKGKYGKVEGDRTMDDIEKRRADRWNFLFIAGMWFQDLFNYDFRRTEMCIIPYATQQGEISFCAYNTGIGWRNIIEKMHMTATLTKWYEEHGRHEIFAGSKAVPLDSTEHSLKLNEEAVRAGAQTDLDELGIAKNAREEKLAGAQAQDARGSAKEAAHHAEMAKLYAQHVLKEQPTLQIQGLGGKKKSHEPAECCTSRWSNERNFRLQSSDCRLGPAAFGRAGPLLFQVHQPLATSHQP